MGQNYKITKGQAKQAVHDLFKMPHVHESAMLDIIGDIDICPVSDARIKDLEAQLKTFKSNDAQFVSICSKTFNQYDEEAKVLRREISMLNHRNNHLSSIIQDKDIQLTHCAVNMHYLEKKLGIE